jgi:hypothetical protein
VGRFRRGMKEVKVNVSRLKQNAQVAQRLAGAL